jgi:membrane-bound ClpP family serine protease
MVAENLEKKRGFTTPEKWVIWGVFCLLVGLSTHRFAVFLGLMLLSIGVNFLYHKRKIAFGVILTISGLLSLIFSKVLF